MEAVPACPLCFVCFMKHDLSGWKLLALGYPRIPHLPSLAPEPLDATAASLPPHYCLSNVIIGQLIVFLKLHCNNSGSIRMIIVPSVPNSSDGHYFIKNTGVRRAKRRAKLKFL